MTMIATRPQNTAMTQRPNGRTLADLLESRKPAMQAVLPRHLTAERLIKIAMVAVSKTPRLMECAPETVLQSVMTAAQLGLDCGGALGQAYLVPFKRNTKDENGRWQSRYECQLILGYRGMIDLARRSGQISSIEARVVWENDTFELEYGIETSMKHKPVLDGDPGDLRLVYAVAHLKDGGTQIEIMTRAQIDAVRRRSKAGDDGPWVTDYPEMARKTVVKRLFKYLPVSVELAEAIERENEAEFDGQDAIDYRAGANTAKALNAKIGQRNLPPEPEQSGDRVVDADYEVTDDEPDAGEATAADDSQVEQQVGPPDEVLDSAQALHDWCMEAGQQHYTPGEFEKAWNAATVHHPLKSARKKDQDAKRAVAIAFAEGRVNAEGEIQQ